MVRRRVSGDSAARYSATCSRPLPGLRTCSVCMPRLTSCCASSTSCGVGGPGGVMSTSRNDIVSGIKTQLCTAAGDLAQGGAGTGDWEPENSEMRC
jgi:hypothetical protein